MSSAINAYGQYQAAEARRKADVRNAAVADWEAGDARSRGTSKAIEMAMRGSAVEASATAAAAHGGVDVGQGTPAAVREGTAALTGLDIAKIRNNAAREAFGFETQAYNFRQDASVQRTNEDLAVVSGVIGTGEEAADYGFAKGRFDKAPAAYDAFPTVGGQPSTSSNYDS
jgi:hypothetical protein